MMSAPQNTHLVMRPVSAFASITASSSSVSAEYALTHAAAVLVTPLRGVAEPLESDP